LQGSDLKSEYLRENKKFVLGRLLRDLDHKHGESIAFVKAMATEAVTMTGFLVEMFFVSWSFLSQDLVGRIAW
jgi:hypothetical protein